MKYILNIHTIYIQQIIKNMGLYSNYCILGKSIFCLITDPDCYKLVLKNEGSFGFEEKTKTTTSKSTLITTNSSGQE